MWEVSGWVFFGSRDVGFVERWVGGRKWLGGYMWFFIIVFGLWGVVIGLVGFR